MPHERSKEPGSATRAVVLDPPPVAPPPPVVRQEPWVTQRAAPQATTTTTLLDRDGYSDDREAFRDEPAVARPPRRKRRYSWRAQAVARAYDRLGTTLALLAAFAVGALLWYLGAMYSLAFIATLSPEVATTLEAAGRWAWLIPVGISVIEIFLFPQAEGSILLTAIRAGLWVGILLFDVYSTYQGFSPWLMSRGVTNITISSVAGISFGMVCAFVPERIFRWVVVEVYEMWLVPISKRFGVRLAQAS